MTSSVQTALPKALPLPVPLTAAASRSPRSTQLKGAKGGGGGGAKGGGEGGGGIGSGGDDGGGGWPRRRRWRHRRRRRWWRRQWRNTRGGSSLPSSKCQTCSRAKRAQRAYAIVYWTRRRSAALINTQTRILNYTKLVTAQALLTKKPRRAQRGQLSARTPTAQPPCCRAAPGASS